LQERGAQGKMAATARIGAGRGRDLGELDVQRAPGLLQVLRVDSRSGNADLQMSIAAQEVGRGIRQ
jgi:hypothetical protein